MSENDDVTSTNGERKPKPTCESGTGGSDTRPVAFISEYAMEIKYAAALEKIQLAVDLSAITLVSFGEGIIDKNGLTEELLKFRVSIVKALGALGAVVK